jgi:hypothetical protein
VIIRTSGARWLPVRVVDFGDWLADLLEQSAARLGADLAQSGRVYRRGSVGSPVTYRGGRAWLRVSPLLENEMDRTAWLGTAEAAPIEGVCKPSLLARIEWCSTEPVPIPVSAEILTLVTDPVASEDRFLRHAPEFGPRWFSDLTASLAALARYPTVRRFRVHAADEYAYLLNATYPRPVSAGLVPEFGTEHVDLTWGNITAPRFCILDMEHWCHAVNGYGAAYLYLTALTVPAVAARIREALSVLDTPSGRYAQLVAAAIILRNLTMLPDPDGLAAALHRHTSMLLDQPHEPGGDA